MFRIISFEREIICEDEGSVYEEIFELSADHNLAGIVEYWAYQNIHRKGEIFTEIDFRVEVI